MTYKAFVSSTFRDLKEHRRHVIDALESAGFFVDPMEKWTASTDAPKQFSQDRVEGCDLCILLVAFRRGHVPRGRKRSITQLEYEAARKLDVDTLVFMLDEQAREKWPAEFDELDKDPALLRWRAELSENKGVGFFDHRPKSVNVAPALTRWMAEHASRRTDEERTKLADEAGRTVFDFLYAVQKAERRSIAQEEYNAAYYEWEVGRARIENALRSQLRDAPLADDWAALADAVTRVYALSGTRDEPYRANVLRELRGFFTEVTEGWDELRVYKARYVSNDEFQTFMAAWWKLRDAALARKDEIVGRILAA